MAHVAESRDQRKIESIRIGTRHPFAGLAASITDVGLLHPVVITPDAALIAGERRLEALQRKASGAAP